MPSDQPGPRSETLFSKNSETVKSRACQSVPVIPAGQEAEAGGSRVPFQPESLASPTRGRGAPTQCPPGPRPQDVILHVRDVSHPEHELQKASVLSALQGLGLPAQLLDSLVEVHNKVDRVPG